ncbi:MAG: right-handed parallel beta-helix repeat-containing protein, partial [Planctomycetota bacterium]
MSEKTNIKNLVAISVFLLVMGSNATARRTIHVPAQFTNIQAAINDANDGDMILVSNGTYRGDGNRDIDFLGKAIIVRSEHGPANCIIDCQGSPTDQHQAFYFHNDENADSILDGFTITNAYHDYGAIFCDSWDGSNPTITNCIISNNHGSYAGAIKTHWYSTPTISNCIISGNSSDHEGAGLNCSGAIVSNCLIFDNRAGEGGGAGIMNHSHYGTMTITNCTIAGNEADSGTAGIWIHNRISPATITNCIVWGNRSNWPSAPQIQVSTSPAPFITYCDVQDGWPGEGNIDADPLFVDADGPDNVFGTDDDNFRLLGGSPCLDIGNNSAVPPSIITDLDGNPRIINSTVDMGAYEGPHQGFLLSARSLVVPEGQTAAFMVALAMDPQGIVEVTVAVESGDPDITIQSGAILTFDSSNYSETQPVTLAAAEDDDYIEGTAVVSVNAAGFSTLGVGVTEDENDNILYVDDDAHGGGTGFNWADAFTTLQEALAAARTNPPITEIRVAQGVYKPDEGAEQTPGDREASFELVNGVDLKGGYAGCGRPNPDKHDIAKYETILSGDLNGDDAEVPDACDLLPEPTRSENSYHVVKGFDFPDCHHEITMVLDGFTITGGNADSNSYWPEDWAYGGGICNRYLRGPAITNCTFTANTAGLGGAICG